MTKSILLAAIMVPICQGAFLGPPSGIPVAWGVGTKLGFGIPGFGGGSNKDDTDEGSEKPKKKISAGGLVQLITAGMGAPFLGDFEGVDEVSTLPLVCLRALASLSPYFLHSSL